MHSVSGWTVKFEHGLWRCSPGPDQGILLAAMIPNKPQTTSYGQILFRIR
jgi:hypothetical protein